MASTAACNLLDKHRHLIANFNFNVTVSVAAVKYSFAQAGEILPKINVFKQYYVYTQAGTCLLLRVNSDVVVMWCIPPPNSSPFFEVFAIP